MVNFLFGAVFIFMSLFAIFLLVDLVFSPDYTFIRGLSKKKFLRKSLSASIQGLFLKIKLLIYFGNKSKGLLNNSFIDLLTDKSVSNVIVNRRHLYIYHKSEKHNCKFISRISAKSGNYDFRELITFHYSDSKSYEKYAHIVGIRAVDMRLDQITSNYVDNIKSKFIINFRDLIGDIQDNDFPFSRHGGFTSDELTNYYYVYCLDQTRLDAETLDVLQNRVSSMFPYGWSMSYYDTLKDDSCALAFIKSL